jgi:hypothetical protein
MAEKTTVKFDEYAAALVAIKAAQATSAAATAGSAPQNGAASSTQAGAGNAATTTGSGGGGNAQPPANGGGGNGGGFNWQNFLGDLTLKSLLLIFVYSIIAVGGLYAVTHDTPPNRAATEKAMFESFNRGSSKNEPKSEGWFAQGTESSSHQQTNQQTIINPCIHLTDLSAGKGYMLSQGECFSMGATPFQISLATQTPITSVTGGDFTIITNDESSSCDSREVNDRCDGWMKDHQILGVEDSNLHKPRYWYLIKPKGNVKIYSA